MKGISAFISVVLLVVIVVAVATIVSGWFSTLATSQTETIENTTKTRLSCQFADMYIINATYNCTGNCSAGNDHTLKVGIKNSGKRELKFDKLVVKNTTGDIFSYDLSSTNNLSIGNSVTLTNVSTTTCAGINNTIESVIASSTNCPNTAFDSIDGVDVDYLEC